MQLRRTDHEGVQRPPEVGVQQLASSSRYYFLVVSSQSSHTNKLRLGHLLRDLDELLHGLIHGHEAGRLVDLLAPHDV